MVRWLTRIAVAAALAGALAAYRKRRLAEHERRLGLPGGESPG